MTCNLSTIDRKVWNAFTMLCIAALAFGAISFLAEDSDASNHFSPTVYVDEDNKGYPQLNKSSVEWGALTDVWIESTLSDISCISNGNYASSGDIFIRFVWKDVMDNLGGSEWSRYNDSYGTDHIQKVHENSIGAINNGKTLIQYHDDKGWHNLLPCDASSSVQWHRFNSMDINKGLKIRVTSFYEVCKTETVTEKYWGVGEYIVTILNPFIGHIISGKGWHERTVEMHTWKNISEVYEFTLHSSNPGTLQIINNSESKDDEYTCMGDGSLSTKGVTLDRERNPYLSIEVTKDGSNKQVSWMDNKAVLEEDGCYTVKSTTTGGFSKTTTFFIMKDINKSYYFYDDSPIRYSEKAFIPQSSNITVVGSATLDFIKTPIIYNGNQSIRCPSAHVTVYKDGTVYLNNPDPNTPLSEPGAYTVEVIVGKSNGSGDVLTYRCSFDLIDVPPGPTINKHALEMIYSPLPTRAYTYSLPTQGTCSITVLFETIESASKALRDYELGRVVKIDGYYWWSPIGSEPKRVNPIDLESVIDEHVSSMIHHSIIDPRSFTVDIDPDTDVTKIDLRYPGFVFGEEAFTDVDHIVLSGSRKMITKASDGSYSSLKNLMDYSMINVEDGIDSSEIWVSTSPDAFTTHTQPYPYPDDYPAVFPIEYDKPLVEQLAHIGLSGKLYIIEVNEYGRESTYPVIFDGETSCNIEFSGGNVEGSTVFGNSISIRSIDPEFIGTISIHAEDSIQEMTYYEPGELIGYRFSNDSTYVLEMIHSSGVSKSFRIVPQVINQGSIFDDMSSSTTKNDGGFEWRPFLLIPAILIMAIAGIAVFRKGGGA